MFKLRYKDMAGSPGFSEAFAKLTSDPALFLPTKVLLNSIRKEMKAKFEIYDETARDIRKDILEVDEKGNAKKGEDNQFIFLEGKSQKDLEDKFGELLQCEVDINTQKIKASQLEKAKLSANDLENLQAMIEWDVEAN